MAVETFECQIARGQINRYLSGENFSGEGMRQLEEHISTCEGCKNALTERKVALQKMLGAESPAPVAAIGIETSIPVTQESAATEATNRELKAKAADQIRAAIRESKATATKADRGTFTKPLIYSALLAMTLLGMSYVSRTIGSRGIKMLAPRPISKPIASTPKIPSMQPLIEKSGQSLGTSILPLADAISSTPQPNSADTTSSSAQPESVEPAATTLPKVTAKVSKTAPSASPKPITIRTRIIAQPVHKVRTIARKVHRTIKPKANRSPKLPIAKDTVTIYDTTGKPVTDN